MEFLRIDKWLWAARFFKTRALAARACELGRVQANDHEAKPAREVRPGDRLKIRTESAQFEVEIAEVTAIRGPAAAAHALYRETEASREARHKAAEERKAARDAGMLLETGRPSKRDRRLIHQFRGRS